MRRIANVYKDEKRGTWYFSLTLGYDRFGKRIQPTRRGFKTQKEAKDAMEELKKNYSDSQEIYLQGITFREFYKKYFFPWYKLGTIEKTYVKTDKTLKRALAYFGKMQMEKLDRFIFKSFNNFLFKNALSRIKKGKYVRYRIIILSRFLISYGLFLNVRWFWKSLMRIQ